MIGLGVKLPEVNSSSWVDTFVSKLAQSERLNREVDRGKQRPHASCFEQWLTESRNLVTRRCNYGRIAKAHGKLHYQDREIDI
jgi:hypothetical protein